MIRAVLFLACLALPSSPAAAQDATPGLVGARMLPGWTQPDGSRVGAIEFQLEPGWKTYWRSPGDSGLPPVFDWAGSDNLADIALHWPAPQAVASGDSMALGYHDRLVLPFTARPADPGRPVDLAVSVDFGLCKNICVPAHVMLHAGPAGATPDPAIQTALAQVPHAASDRPDCTLHPIEDGMRVTATLPRPVVLAAIELAGSDAWVSGTRAAAEPGGTVLTADVVPPEAAPFALAKDRLVFTVIGEAGGAVEMRGCSG